MLIVLCTTEIISSGIHCHAFPVLLPTISSQTGWSQAVITAGFPASQIVARRVGVPVGKLLDRHGPRAVMTTGSVVAVPALTALTLVAGLASTVFAPLTAASRSRRFRCTCSGRGHRDRRSSTRRSTIHPPWREAGRSSS
ncbi:hypothetical protein [Lentzea sp. CC55]|uniref:hypothetical protein n=1 Tax=Lentzea sp. CC55 TaxID=2884909 RepID=UPI001F342646|nr:hypothetical protein [Lentzea sp. CC55]MCG8927381.1 hypothetical protein [Lentzea sp. CC55]